MCPEDVEWHLENFRNTEYRRYLGVSPCEMIILSSVPVFVLSKKEETDVSA